MRERRLFYAFQGRNRIFAEEEYSKNDCYG